MTRYHIYLILLVLIAGLNVKTRAVEFAGGTGQPDDPYQIATPTQLIAIGQDPNLQDKHFVLIDDLDMDPNLSGGQLLNSSLVLTTGSFDGAGYTITNLGGRIWVEGGRAGFSNGFVLFAYIGIEAVVRDLNIEGEFFGAHAMFAEENEGTILNCSAIGSILIPEGSGRGLEYYIDRAGFVWKNAGIIMGSFASVDLPYGSGLVVENSGTIVACYTTTDIENGPAGLVGTNLGIIDSCYAFGDVQFSDSPAGGLVGVNSGTISYSYATGSVLSEDIFEGEGVAGGLVGSNDGDISYCYATGAGGMALVGENGRNANIKSCFALSPRYGGGKDDSLCVLLSDIQMRQRESFIGWDFAGTSFDGTLDIWMMTGDGGYPKLTIIEAPHADGIGTADDPYLIETYPQLMSVFNEPKAYYRLAADIDLGGRCFSSCLIPFFEGRFDGDGHCVYNFTLRGETTVGLFRTLHSRSIVTGLHIRSVQIILIDEGPVTLFLGLGALAACNKGTVTNCSAVTESHIEEDGRFGVLGGLIGVNEGGYVSMCSARLLTENGGGGLVGRNRGTISQCHASIYASGDIYGGGGLVGQNTGSVIDCYADGYLSGSLIERRTGDYTGSAGGLAATNTGNITRCYVVTEIEATHPGGGLVGGDEVKGTVMDSYFLAQADGGGADNGIGMPLSRVEMRQRDSFAGWDFDEIWTICEGIDYPRLRWEGVMCEER